MNPDRGRRRWPELTGPCLTAHAEVRVRFQEVDALAVVWHGHYLAYFEAARDAFGRRYGLTYEDVRRAGYVVPLVHASVDYRAPARFGDVLTVTARLYPEAAARISFGYEVRAGERFLASGRTVQAFTDLDGTLVLTRPRFYEEWLARWEGALAEP